MSAPYWWHSHKEKSDEGMKISERFERGPKVSELFAIALATPVAPEETRKRPVVTHTASVPKELVEEARSERERFIAKMKGSLYGSQHDPLPGNEPLGQGTRRT